MKEREMRFRIAEDIFKRYRLICIEKDLSIPKQTADIIKHFVEVQEENKERIRKCKEI